MKNDKLFQRFFDFFNKRVVPDLEEKKIDIKSIIGDRALDREGIFFLLDVLVTERYRGNYS